MNLVERIREWRKDPCSFMRSLIDPETDKPFELYPSQEVFFNKSLTLTPDGRLPYPELVYSGPKKSGKTAIAAMVQLYVILVLSKV
jgi:hypothetical protein